MPLARIRKFSFIKCNSDHIIFWGKKKKQKARNKTLCRFFFFFFREIMSASEGKGVRQS